MLPEQRVISDPMMYSAQNTIFFLCSYYFYANNTNTFPFTEILEQENETRFFTRKVFRIIYYERDFEPFYMDYDRFNECPANLTEMRYCEFNEDRYIDMDDFKHSIHKCAKQCMADCEKLSTKDGRDAIRS